MVIRVSYILFALRIVRSSKVVLKGFAVLCGGFGSILFRNGISTDLKIAFAPLNEIVPETGFFDFSFEDFRFEDVILKLLHML